MKDLEKKEFLEILKRYQEHTATEEEVSFLKAYYKIFELSEDGLSNFSADEEILVSQRLKNKIDASIRNVDAPEVTVDKRWRPRWFSLAAAVLLVGGISLYFLNQPGAPESKVALATSNPSNILPGRNHAVLTLANGQVVALEEHSSATEIASSAGIRISKNAGGELVYEVTGDVVNTSPVYNTVETPRGGQYQIALSDGSRVWLNAASSLKFPASFAHAGRRKVELKGEAYFEIASDKAHPFEVFSAGQRVEVLGTHFNVNAYEDEPYVTTTLLEGSVTVSYGNASKTIRPGQQAKVKDDIQISWAAGDAIAWKNGITSFEKADIKSIMRKVARWYDLDIQYEGAIPDRSFTGGISRKDDLSALTRILESSNIKYRLNGHVLTITP